MANRKRENPLIEFLDLEAESGAIPSLEKLEEAAARNLDFEKIEKDGRVSLSAENRRRLGSSAVLLFGMMKPDTGSGHIERKKRRKFLLNYASNR